MPTFDELPFQIRPDLSPYLFHFTKRSSENGKSALDNLCNILETGIISGTNGFIKGPNSASCFMDVPLMALKYVFTKQSTKPDSPPYEPYGIMVAKQDAYERGVRPVLYLSDKEIRELGIQEAHSWRIVKLELNPSNKNWICWLHEREWRKMGDFSIPTDMAVLVKTSSEAQQLSELIKKGKYKCNPRTVLPLNIICQGLNLK